MTTTTRPVPSSTRIGYLKSMIKFNNKNENTFFYSFYRTVIQELIRTENDYINDIEAIVMVSV